VIQGLAAHLGGFDEDLEVTLELVLAYELVEDLGLRLLSSSRSPSASSDWLPGRGRAPRLADYRRHRHGPHRHRTGRPAVPPAAILPRHS